MRLLGGVIGCLVVYASTTEVAEDVSNLRARLEQLIYTTFYDEDEALKFLEPTLAVYQRRLEVDQAAVEDVTPKYSNGRVWSIVGAATLILGLSIFGVFLPDIIRLLLQSANENDEYSTTRILVESLCNSFAAGGFWGLALIHVLKEAVDNLDSLRWGMKVGHEYCNGAYLLICAGYLVTLAVQGFATTTTYKQRLKVGEAVEHTTAIDRRAAILDATVAALALSFHAFFEGMVIGMRPTGVLVWIATTSVAGHKWAEAFALSQRVAAYDISKRVRIALLSTFLFATPIGALVGMPLGALSDSPVGGIMSSISCGVLVYVAGETTTEIFKSEVVCESTTSTQPGDLEEPTQEMSTRETQSEGANKANLEATLMRINSSYWILLSRLTLMLGGMVLLAGMMLVELKIHQ